LVIQPHATNTLVNIIQVVKPFLYVNQKEEVVASHGLQCKSCAYPFKNPILLISFINIHIALREPLLLS